MACEFYIYQARLTRALMAGIFTVMLHTIQKTTTGSWAAELGSLSQLAWHSLRFFTAMTLYSDIYGAGRTATRVAQDLTLIVSTVRVLLPVAVFATWVRESQCTVARLLNLAAEACIDRHLVFSIGKVTVWTGPRVKSSQSLCDLLIMCHSIFIDFYFISVVFILVWLMVTIIDSSIFPFFIFLLLYCLFESLVLFLDPSLHAAHMEWLVALTTIPNSTTLVDRIWANDALGSALT